MNTTPSNILLTTERPIQAPNEAVLNSLIKKNKVGTKLRHFEFRFANPMMWKTAQFMEKVDLWRHVDGYPSKSMFEVGNISSKTTLSTEEYQQILAYAIEETGGKLFSFVETTNTSVK